MKDDQKSKTLLAGIVAAVVVFALVSLAIPSLRVVGAVILLAYWAVISYYFQLSIWYPDRNQAPSRIYIIMSVVGALLVIGTIAVMLAQAP